MTNIPALITMVLVTNVSNVRVHEGCSLCETHPDHVTTTNVMFAGTLLPRNVRRETTEVVEQSIVSFVFEGVPHVSVINSTIVSRSVRRFRVKQIESEDELK